jgi:Skp family chaperone for outer membrane proteins
MITPPSPKNFWHSLRKSLFDPPASMSDVGQRRQAQLAAWISLILAAWFLMAVISILAIGNVTFGAAILFVVVVASLVSYAFSRTHSYQVASWMLTIIFIVSGYSMLAILPLKDAGPTFLAQVVLGLVIGSALLTVQSLSLVVVLSTACWIVVASFLPAADRPDFFAPAASSTIAGILLAVFSGVRNLIERDRLRELAAANRELRAIQNTLEERVAERTALSEAARQEAETARKALENEIWLTSGQVVVNEALRGQQSFAELANRAIQAICHYLNAPVGMLFVWQEEKMQLAGSYAYAPTADQPSTSFSLGQGLLGQMALDRQPLYLKQVPPGYLNVISGLGETLPRQLVIWPLQYNDELAGAIEIGLMNSLTAQQEQFFRHAAESLAAALQTALARARIDELLMKTQAQAEELQTREEELRAINDELQAQSETLNGGNVIPR